MWFMMSGAMAPFPDMLVCVATIYDIGPGVLKLVHAQMCMKYVMLIKVKCQQ